MAEMSDHQDSEHFTYDRSWDEIEQMLDKDRKENEYVNQQISCCESKRLIKLL